MLLAPASSQANIGMGQGMGIMDLPMLSGSGAAPPPTCSTNFVFDWTDSCNGITAAIR